MDQNDEVVRRPPRGAAPPPDPDPKAAPVIPIKSDHPARPLRTDVEPLSRFPSKAKTPRAIQAYAIREVYKQFAAGKRFVVLEAPTGSGKSHIAIALARLIGRTYFTTLTKALQSQYVDEVDFNPYGVAPLKGRSAYTCDRVRGTCEDGGKRFKAGGGNACDPCPYRIAKAKAFEADIAICSYHSFLASVAPLAGDLSRRDLLVCDEAHEVERVLMDSASIVIREAQLPGQHAELPRPTGGIGPNASYLTIDDYWKWCGELAEFLSARVTNGVSDPDGKSEQLVRDIGTALWARQRNKYVLEVDDDGRGFALKPVTVSSLGGIFFNRADRVLLMSGTILDFDTFCRTVGVPRSEAAFVSVPCTFPKENRPIIVGRFDMTKQARAEEWPKMVRAVETILKYHSAQKGLLLCPSNEMIKFIVARLPPALSQRLLPMYGRERELAFKRHVESNAPTVLVASGAWEGMDLREDLSRFQIIPQMPRPFLSQQVRARMDVDRGWYRWKTICRLVQGYGRSVRSETDRATTYILDGDFRAEVESQTSLLPAWFKEAVVYSRGSA